LLLVAKNDRAHRWLQDQFRHRQVRKTYLALVDGHPPTPRGRIEAPVGRDPLHRQKMSVLPPGKGREAITEYHTLEAFRQHTLLEVHPLTGRTHQIRVHMAFLGCPIVGDTLYGHRHPSLPVSRHFLHAARLTLRLPGENEPRTFEAPLPADLERILAWLRQYQPA
jgi:23S rRNA pseudouridine1911/1915/1917 synthase